jgi:GntR family transcriptional regulator of abcA and norABC
MTINQIDKKKKQPLYQQIVTYYIEAIQAGEYAPGDRLPAERRLATEFGVNRSTIVKALDELQSLGWITRKQGSGTQVTEGRWGNRQTPLSYLRSSLSSPYLQQDPFVEEVQRLRHSGQGLDLYSGNLPQDLLPDFQFPAFTWETIRQESHRSTPAGYPPLQEILLQHLQEDFNIESSGQKLVVTSGSTQGISLLMQVLLASGDCILTEEPSFLFSLPLFSTMNVRVLGIKQDQEGMLPADLEQTLKEEKIKFVYLNPTFQNPTGHTMSLTRRKAIIEICQRYQVPIIEDDIFSELAFTPQPAKFKSLAPESVIYLGSLSKLFGSSIKIGWLLAPEELANQFAQAKKRMSIDTTIFPQLLANLALRSKEYQQQQQLLLKQMAHRQRNLIDLLATFSEDWQFQPTDGGLYLWLQRKHGYLKRKDWTIFLENNCFIAPSFLFSNDTNGFRLNYTRLTEEQLPLFQQYFTKITNQLKEHTYERNN